MKSAKHIKGVMEGGPAPKEAPEPGMEWKFRDGKWQQVPILDENEAGNVDRPTEVTGGW